MRELLRQRAVTLHYLARGVQFWTGLRLLLGLVMLLAGAGSGWLEPSPVMPLVVGAVGGMDLLRRRELVLLANLGISATVMIALYAAAGIAGELSVALLHLALR